MAPIGTRGSPNSATIREALLIHPVGASLPTNLAGRPSRRASSSASQRTSRVCGPVTLSGLVGDCRPCQAAQRNSARVALPDHIDVPHAQVDRFALPNLGGDVVQDAVAHVDCVVQSDDAAWRTKAAPKNVRACAAADAGIGVVARWRHDRRVLGRSAAFNGDKRIDAPR